jgi:hypothetical protein
MAVEIRTTPTFSAELPRLLFEEDYDMRSIGRGGDYFELRRHG